MLFLIILGIKDLIFIGWLRSLVVWNIFFNVVVSFKWIGVFICMYVLEDGKLIWGVGILEII